MSRDSDDETPLRELARGFRKRTMVTVGLASRVGLGFAKRTLFGRSEEKPTTPAP